MILTHGANGIRRSHIEEGLVYHSDFSNFDYDTGVDVPIVGTNGLYSFENKSYVSKTSITVEGVSVSALKFNGNGSISLYNISDFVTFDDDVFSVECKMLVESQVSGTLSFGFATCNWCVCPAFNGYSGRQGYLLVRAKDRYASQTYNGFDDIGEDFYESTEPEFVNIVGNVLTGGMTKNQNQLKFYTMGKKAVRRGLDDQSNLVYYYSQTGTVSYLLEMKIYKDVDRFEMMD